MVGSGDVFGDYLLDFRDTVEVKRRHNAVAVRPATHSCHVTHVTTVAMGLSDSETKRVLSSMTLRSRAKFTANRAPAVFAEPKGKHGCSFLFCDCPELCFGLGCCLTRTDIDA